MTSNAGCRALIFCGAMRMPLIEVTSHSARSSMTIWSPFFRMGSKVESGAAT